VFETIGMIILIIVTMISLWLNSVLIDKIHQYEKYVKDLKEKHKDDLEQQKKIIFWRR